MQILETIMKLLHFSYEKTLTITVLTGFSAFGYMFFEKYNSLNDKIVELSLSLQKTQIALDTANRQLEQSIINAAVEKAAKTASLEAQNIVLASSSNFDTYFGVLFYTGAAVSIIVAVGWTVTLINNSSSNAALEKLLKTQAEVFEQQFTSIQNLAIDNYANLVHIIGVTGGQVVQNTVEALSFAIRDSAVNNFGPNFGAHNAMPALNTLTNSALNTPFLAITNNSPILTTLSDITINSAESAAVGIVQAAEQGLNVVFDNLIDGAGSYLTHTMPVSLETSYIITNQEYYPLIDSFEWIVNSLSALIY